MKGQEAGAKYDAGKLKFSFLNLKYLYGMIKVLMFGAQKYQAHSWMDVKNGEVRYWEALMRHMVEMQEADGTINLDALDSETGKPHLWHVQCNAYFLEKFRQDQQVCEYCHYICHDGGYYFCGKGIKEMVGQKTEACSKFKKTKTR